MPFADRGDAGRRLAARLQHLRGERVVVLGLPRGGVPVAFEVARALGAPLDVIVVRKLGVPCQPELGMGAIGEDGVRIINREIVRLAGVSADELTAVQEREQAELERRAWRYRAGGPRQPLAGRVAVVVDDGIATGSTARAACQIARAHGAARVVLAVPVAPPGWEARMGADADEMVCVQAPSRSSPSGSPMPTSARQLTTKLSPAFSAPLRRPARQRVLRRPARQRALRRPARQRALRRPRRTRPGNRTSRLAPDQSPWPAI